MFCPKCWREYPKGMRTCDSCRVELIEEKPKEMGGQGGKTDKPSSPADDKKKK